MATKEEKEAAVAAQQAEVQAVVAQRTRREAGALPAPKMRASGDMSRYKVGYTDDPYAVPFEDLTSPGALPPPERVDVTPPPATSGGSGGASRPPRRTPTPVRTIPKPPRAQPGTSKVPTPYGGWRTVSEGKVPQTGALYETNPKTTVTTASARARLAEIQKGQLERSTPAVQSVTSSTGVTRKVSSGKTAQTGMMYEGKGGVIASAPKGPAAAKTVKKSGATKGVGSGKTSVVKVVKVQTAKKVAAKKVNAAKPAKPVSKAVKK